MSLSQGVVGAPSVLLTFRMPINSPLRNLMNHRGLALLTPHHECDTLPSLTEDDVWLCLTNISAGYPSSAGVSIETYSAFYLARGSGNPRSNSEFNLDSIRGTVKLNKDYSNHVSYLGENAKSMLRLVTGSEAESLLARISGLS